MRSMVISRRQLLGGFAASLAAWPGIARPAPDTGRRIYLSARGDATGGFRAAAFNQTGRPLFDLPLPARGHSLAIRPGRAEAVFFARRPGTFACAVDIAAGVLAASFETPLDRHFYGHGVFDRDGRLLYATENDFTGGRGVLGVYDAAQGYRRVGELPTHGVGPHDLRLLSDGVTLVVANGGIESHPDLPRADLNIPEMNPSLAYIDRRDGRLLAELRLAPSLNLLSIRHLAVGADDRVAFAMQYQGPAGDKVPLVGVRSRDGAVRLFDEATAGLRRMRQYCGSIAFDSRGRTVAATLPRGGVVVFWDTDSMRSPGVANVGDVCGVAPLGGAGEFLVSSGEGGAFTVEARAAAVLQLRSSFLDAGHWDNHILPAVL